MARPQPRMGRHSWRNPHESAAEKQRQCDSWNFMHKPGTAVIVTRDNGDEQQTKTRSEAWVLSGHTPVIQLEGISGCYELKRVRPAPTVSGGKSA